MRNDTAVFILSFGRSDRVYTYQTLRSQGYTGRIYIVCSTDDKTIPLYQQEFGEENVLIFSKEDYVGKFDIGDNFSMMNVVVFARNAAWDIAKQKGLKYFIELDDDYTDFQIREPKGKVLKTHSVMCLDYIFEEFIRFMENAPQVKCIAMAQGGDYIGGVGNDIFTSLNRKRKLMNVYFNATDRPYQFYGRINEDTNCYVQNGKVGDIFLTHPSISIVQLQTQSNKGGLTEFYLETGTYVKSFYTVMFNPSAVQVQDMGDTHRRLHHHVKWQYAVPKIIREVHKKK